MAAIKRAGVLRVASDLSYPPLAFRDGETPAGLEIDLGDVLAAALGVRAEIIDAPRALVQPGFADADLLIGGWTERTAPGPASAPYYVMRQAILWREGQAPGSDGSLRALRVAVQAQSPGEAMARQLGAGSLVAVYQPAQALAAVSRGEAQAAVVDWPLASEYARTHGHLRVSPGQGPEVPLVVVVRAGAPDLLAFTSAAIQELDRGGGLASLRRRWRQ